MLLCLTVFAQPPGSQGGKRGGGEQRRGGKPDPAKILEVLDTDNDSQISRREASKDRRGRISENFDQIDTNKDDVIDLEELTASLENRRNSSRRKKLSAEKLFKEVDDNEDGKLNELELAAKEKSYLIKNFDTIDINEDAEIDLEELKMFYSKHIKKKRRNKD